MLVKIGDDIYTHEDVAISITLSEFDKEQIIRMAPDQVVYAAFPDGFSKKERSQYANGTRSWSQIVRKHK